MDTDSAQILAEYLDGNNDAARRIFDKYTVRLVALAQTYLSPMLQARVDPEDIVQSAYRSFFRRVQDQDYLLKRSGDLWRLLAAYTHNKARSRVEKEMAEMRDPRLQTPLPDVTDCNPRPDDALILIEQLTLFFRQVTPRERRIVEMRLRGESIDAIVAEFASPPPESGTAPENISAATVRRILRDVKHVLVQVLSKS